MRLAVPSRTFALTTLALTTLACVQVTSAPAPPAARSAAPVGSVARADCALAPRSHTDSLVDLGRAEGDTFIEILDVRHRDGRVYSCTATQGITIWDVSDPKAGKLLVESVGPPGVSHKKYPRCQHIDLDPGGTRMLITNRGDEIQKQPWLFLYDVARPREPVVIAGWVGDASIEGAIFFDDVIVAAAHGRGLLVFKLDAANKRLKLIAEHAEPNTNSWVPVKHGNRIVVAEETGLAVYQLESHQPRRVGFVAIDGSSKDVALRGNTAYVATSLGFAVVDLAKPEKPRVVSQTQTPGTALEVAHDGRDTLYVADWDEVRAYDVSKPDEPRHIGSERVLQPEAEFTRVLAIDAHLDHAYIGEWRGLHVLAKGRDTATPEVSITPEKIQLGTVAPGATETADIEIHNGGGADLVVSGVRLSSPSLSVDETCFRVAPGKSMPVTLRFAPTDANPIAGTATWLTDDPDEREVALKVTANVDGLDIGDPAPSFARVDLDGKRWSNAALKGKVTLLAYFATF